MLSDDALVTPQGMHDEVIQRMALTVMEERQRIIEKNLRLLPQGWFLCVHKDGCHGVPWLEACEGVEREVMGPMTEELRRRIEEHDATRSH